MARPAGLKLGLFATGGTIAMQPAKGGGLSPSLGAAAVAGTAGLAGIEVVPRDIVAKPSPSIALADIAILAEAIAAAEREGMAGVVVTHGTDTIEETAFALALMARPGIPVALTGAMRPAGLPGAEGPANVLAALRVAATAEAAGYGPLVVMDDEIHLAALVFKTHAARTHAFSSAPLGPVGYLFEDAVRFALRPMRALPRLALAGAPPPVAILHVAADLEPETVSAFRGSDVAGLVIAGVGGGHVSSRAVDALTALAAERPVVLTSRVGQGGTLAATYGYAGGEIDLVERGLVHGGRWRPVQARIILQLLLSQGADRATIAAALA